MKKLSWMLAPAMVWAAVALSPQASAIPGLPTCPGNGNDSVAGGADGGWCDFYYMPDPVYGMTHVTCRWADFTMMIDIGGHTECRRVDAKGNLLPDSPPWEYFANWGANEGSNTPGAPPQ